MRNVEIPGPTQQLLCSKYHDFLAIFALAHSKINQIALFLDDYVKIHLNRLYTWQHSFVLRRHVLY